LENENGDDAVKAAAPEEKIEAGLSAVGASSGEVLTGLNSVDAAGVVAAGVSVFWADSSGLEKENADGAVKGLEAVDRTEPDPLGKIEAGLSAVDAGGNMLVFENAGAGRVAADVSVLGAAYAGTENMDEEEVDAKADGDGPVRLMDERAGFSVVSG
jgi:hypothetical protein